VVAAGRGCCCSGFAVFGFGSRAGLGDDAEPDERDGGVFDRVGQRTGTGKAGHGGECGASEVWRVAGDRQVAAQAGPTPRRLPGRQRFTVW
jgi:hypothetical protein